MWSETNQMHSVCHSHYKHDDSFSINTRWRKQCYNSVETYFDTEFFSKAFLSWDMNMNIITQGIHYDYAILWKRIALLT